MALRKTLAACALESGRRHVSLGVHPAQLLQRLLVGELLLDVRRYPLRLRPVQRLERRRWRVDRIDRRSAILSKQHRCHLVKNATQTAAILWRLTSTARALAMQRSDMLNRVSSVAEAMCGSRKARGSDRSFSDTFGSSSKVLFAATVELQSRQ